MKHSSSDSNPGDFEPITGCDPREIGLKSFFLGPQAENSRWIKKLANSIFINWFKWRRAIHPKDGSAITGVDQESPDFLKRKEDLQQALNELFERFKGEVPTFTPRYIGHMLSEISVPALLGHILTLLYNPNNITQEVSQVGLDIEQEAIMALARLLGFDGEAARGHFTSGGTVANIEGLVRARARMARWLAASLCCPTSKRSHTLFEAAHQGWTSFDRLAKDLTEEDLRRCNFLHSNPVEIFSRFRKAFGTDYKGPVVLAPNSKHYSWPKGIILLGLGAEAFWPIELNARGELSLRDLKAKIERAKKEHRPVLAVISVAGTTELGDFDPIHRVSNYLGELKNRDNLHIWHHVDAAYGGFFRCLPKGDSSPAAVQLFEALEGIKYANSATIDPHKLGYVPYSCGAFLTSKTREYYVTPFDAPYLRWEQKKFSGTQTLEGSRSAGGAVATWLTARTIGFTPEGLGLILEKTIGSTKKLETALKYANPLIRVAPHGMTNILCFCMAETGENLSVTNTRTTGIYNEFVKRKDTTFYVSKTKLSWEAYRAYLDSFVCEWSGKRDDDSLVLIRLTLMNPFFDSKETAVDYTEEFIKALTEIIGDIEQSAV